MFVEGGVTPGVDVQCEARLGDVGGVGLHAPVVILINAQLLKLQDDLGRLGVWLRERDDAGRLRLGLVPRVVVVGREGAVLKVAVVLGHVEPGAPSRVGSGVTPSVEVGLDVGSGVVVVVRLDADVGAPVDVEPGEARGETQVMSRNGNVLRVQQLGVIPGTNLQGVEVVGVGGHNWESGLYLENDRRAGRSWNPVSWRKGSTKRPVFYRRVAGSRYPQVLGPKRPAHVILIVGPAIKDEHLIA
ncbi:hypothetical protein FRB96_002312 [Tulasnella sp. 330]|nr:hypothetical protein FRB96_002312 [Tulasnella sp. 330]